MADAGSLPWTTHSESARTERTHAPITPPRSSTYPHNTCTPPVGADPIDMTVMKTAYEDPNTRRSWRRTALFRLCTLLLSLTSLAAWLCAALATPAWTLTLLVPALLTLLYVALLSAVRLFEVVSLRRLLRVYPWQTCPGAADAARNGTVRFSFTDPERSERYVSVGHGNWLGSGLTFWARAVKAGAVDEVWFAGDPRFLGVVATPGPRRLMRVAQPEALDGRMPARRRGVGPEARARAEAAGARVG